MNFLVFVLNMIFEILETLESVLEQLRKTSLLLKYVGFINFFVCARGHRSLWVRVFCSHIERALVRGQLQQDSRSHWVLYLAAGGNKNCLATCPPMIKNMLPTPPKPQCSLIFDLFWTSFGHVFGLK